MTELTLYCDGGSRGNPGPSAIGAVVYDTTIDPPQLVATVSECIGVTTNNVAEYRALIAGLEAVADLRARIIHVRVDSMLIIKQLRGEWKVKHANMRPLYARAQALLAEYEVVDLQHVRREENAAADALVNAALDAVRTPPEMFFWLALGSIFGVWNVFQSPGLDFRLVALGAPLPLALDAPFGEQAYAHTLASAVVVFVVVMALTAGRGQKLRRRRYLSLAIGWFSGLVLAGAWMHQEVFWWPAFGTEFAHVPLLAPWPIVVIEELLGLAALWWAWTRFGLSEPARRRALWHRGRLAIVVGEGR